MKLVYPYNEILPKKAAHDVYIFSQCAALAKAGFDVTLLCGKWGLDDAELFKHYQVKNNAFRIKKLPILRKNPLNWNAPFFFFSERAIRDIKPDWVFLSVLKQALYHLRNKIPGVRYVYEAHELAFYPNMEKIPCLEREILAKADLITVTTNALKRILLDPPYSLTTPIEVIPLAVQAKTLPPPPENVNPLTLMYVGQLYTGQGVDRLIAALALVEGVHLKIVGGKPKEIALLKELDPAGRVEFYGFVPPSELSEIAKQAHAFVAPFDSSERMPYVAHTKLFEYARWGRPIIAPDLPCVREHFSENHGTLLYEAENIEALAKCINLLKDTSIRSRLQSEIAIHKDLYSWETRAACIQNLLI